MSKIKIDWFIAAILTTIVVAYFFPEANDALPLGTISQYGIAGIFFFYGLKLNFTQLKIGLSNWKLHTVVQGITFLIFPLLALIIYPFISHEYHELWLALFFLCALPSTVSSSVVMVSIAEGNIPAAIFNASISGLIGIFITPFWMGLFINAQGGDFEFSTVLSKLVIQILLPVMAGMLMNRFWGNWAERNKKKLANFDKSIILLIVYKSFSTSFEEDIFSNMPLPALIIMAGAVMSLFLITYGFISKLSNWLHFSREDRITALFCGSKKSLVHGSVFAGVLFAGMAEAGLYLVPVMLYHAFQLIVVSIIAQRMAKENFLDK